MPPNMVSPKQKSRKRQGKSKKTPSNTVLFVQRHDSLSHTLLIFFFRLVFLGKTKQMDDGTSKASIGVSFRAGEIFRQGLGWMEKQKKLFWVSFSTGAHTGNTLVQTQQTTLANFSPFLLQRKVSYRSSGFFSQRFQGLKGLEICRRA
jgi:hypothetical protein